MKQIIITCLVLSSFTSCGLWKNYQRDNTSLPLEGLYAKEQKEAVADTSNLGMQAWRDVFVDHCLQELIEKALVQNADLQKAQLTINQAQSALKVSRLSFLPSLSFSPQGTVTSWDFNKATQSYRLPLLSSWQIDAFGSLRNKKQESKAMWLQAKAAQQATQTAIVAQVANLYYTLTMLDAQLKTTEQTADIWARNVETMKSLFEVGLTTSAAVSKAEANRLSIVATIPLLKSSISSTENAICLLLHEPSASIPRGEMSGMVIPSSISIGSPLQLLAQRPDVRAAELQLTKTFYGVQVARAAFYPQLTISGSGAWINNVGAIVNPGKMLASAVGSLVQPLFAQGKIRAHYKIAQEQQKAAQIDFEQTLLKAGMEVSNAYSKLNQLTEAIATQKKHVEATARNAEETEYIFKNGNSVTYLETLVAQQSLLQAQLQLISLTFDRMQTYISLYQSLGGGVR